jgi:poly(3-hydroxybutyrate) depolymerase
MTVNGETRQYVLQVPPDDGTSKALVIAYHWGGGTDGAAARSWWDFASKSGNEAVVIYPYGITTVSGYPQDWARGENERDTLMFDAMLEQLPTQFCLDPSRVFIFGFSSGGFWTQTLVTFRANKIRAAASIEAYGPFGNAPSPVALLMVNGTQDTIATWPNAQATLASWLSTNGCSMNQAPFDPSPCVAYTSCSSGDPVAFCSGDWGHTVPSFALQAVWNFFAGR